MIESTKMMMWWFYLSRKKTVYKNVQDLRGLSQFTIDSRVYGRKFRSMNKRGMKCWKRLKINNTFSVPAIDKMKVGDKDKTDLGEYSGLRVSCCGKTGGLKVLNIDIVAL
ncbi:hypothetical protein [Acinetobacter sp. ANC 4173]|uniref:hypothetical protein n=1 Tax=Acinetobacter sp. ANC 4173 TaxID=2529837 RepID=UPI0026CFBA22